jgi:hypothetical protein
VEGSEGLHDRSVSRSPRAPLQQAPRPEHTDPVNGSITQTHGRLELKECSANAKLLDGLTVRTSAGAVGSTAPLTSCIVTLHACGDLSPSTIRAFAQCTLSSALVNVGCCYHNLTTADNSAPSTCSDATQSLVGFPMSRFVQARIAQGRAVISNLALRQAAQSTPQTHTETVR